MVCPGEAVGKQDKIHIPWFELTVQEGVGEGEEKYWEKQQGEVKVSIRFHLIPITALLRVGFGSLRDRASFS